MLGLKACATAWWIPLLNVTLPAQPGSLPQACPWVTLSMLLCVCSLSLACSPWEGGTLRAGAGCQVYTVHSGSHLHVHFQPVPTKALRLKASRELFTAVDTERGGSLCSCLGTAQPVRWCLALWAGIWPTLPPRSFKVLKALATRPATCLRIGWFPCGTWAQWWEKRSCHLLPSFFKCY